MRFKELRAAIMLNGYKQSEIAKKIGMTVSTFSLRMTAKMPFTLNEAYSIADILHIPEEELHTYFPRDGVS